MLLLLPFAFSFPTQAEDNSPEAVVNPDAGQSPVIPGSGNELPQTPDSNLNSTNGNSETPADNSVQPGSSGTPGSEASGTGADGQTPGNPGADTETPITPATPEEAVIPYSVKKTPPHKAPGGIAINKDNFPDYYFREHYVKQHDSAENGFLSEDELSRTEEFLLHYPQFPVADRHGLEYFTSLQNLVVNNQPLSKLDVSSNTKLIELTAFESQLRELTFGDNQSLAIVYCYQNKLTSLDVHALNGLYEHSCRDNKLTTLKLGKHPLLRSLSCNNNLLSTLSLNQCENLEWLICNDNQLTTLDLSNNLKLSEIDISNNALTELDLSHNQELDVLWCSNNHLTSLDLSKNLKLSAEYFKGEHQTFSIEVDKDTLEFDLSSLPGNFIPARASDWKGASVSGMTLNLDPSMPATVTYNYNADLNRLGFIMDVTLFVTYVSKNILIPCPYGAVICPTQPAYQTIPLTPVPVQQKSADNIQGQVAQLPKTGEQESRAVVISSLLLLSLGAFFIISRRK